MKKMCYSPMESFGVIPMLGPINDVALYLVIAISLIGALSYIYSANQPLVPSSWGLGLESYNITLYSMVRSHIGSKSGVYFPFIYTLFTFLFFSNLFGLLPYSTTPTAH